jgi:hypothetical protein
MNSGKRLYCLRGFSRPDAPNPSPLGTFVVALLNLCRTFVVAFNAHVLDAKKEAAREAIGWNDSYFDDACLPSRRWACRA